MTDAKLKLRIQDDMKNAMRAQDKKTLETVRFLLAAIKQKEIDERITLDDTQTLAIIEKQIKQRKDSIEQYTSAGREELANKESFELKILQSYMPEQLSTDDLAKLIQDAISKTNAASMRDMGKVMGILKPQIQGRADMSAVSAKIKELLQG